MKLLQEFLRDWNRERRACGNAEPKLWQHGNIFHFTERLIENGHPWKNCCITVGEIGEDGAWRSVAADDYWHTAHNQWCKKVAETIGMRDRNDAEIQIGIANSHRLADLIAIGQKLFAAKANEPRHGRRSRRQFEKRWRPVPPIRDFASRSDRESCLRLLLADGFIERKNNTLRP